MPWIERVGGASHRARYRLHELPSDRHLDRQTDFHVRRVGLGDVDEHAKRVDLGDPNSPFAPPVTLEGATAVLLVGLPAVINAPTSTFRWITVPLNGARTR